MRISIAILSLGGSFGGALEHLPCIEQPEVLGRLRTALLKEIGHV